MTTSGSYHDEILADCAAIESTIISAGTARSVPHCQGWSTGDVVRHLGGVHRWTTEVARTRQPAIVEPDDVNDAELIPWLASGAIKLCNVLASGDPNGQCWTFGFPPEKLWFWSRRQALETTVHRVDIEAATSTRTPISAWLAADGVEEVVTCLFPRQIALGRSSELSGQVKLTLTDTDRTFLLGTPGGAKAELQGPAQDVLLHLWQRPCGNLESEGDASVLAELATVALTP